MVVKQKDEDVYYVNSSASFKANQWKDETVLAFSVSYAGEATNAKI